MGSSSPSFGVKIKKYLSCHHLVSGIFGCLWPSDQQQNAHPKTSDSFSKVRSCHEALKSCDRLPPGSLTVRPWKMMVGRWVSFSEGLFLGSMLNFRGVGLLQWGRQRPLQMRLNVGYTMKNIDSLPGFLSPKNNPNRHTPYLHIRLHPPKREDLSPILCK